MVATPLLCTSVIAKTVPMTMTAIPNNITKKAIILESENHFVSDSFKKQAVGSIKASGTAVKQPCVDIQR